MGRNLSSMDRYHLSSAETLCTVQNAHNDNDLYGSGSRKILWRESKNNVSQRLQNYGY